MRGWMMPTSIERGICCTESLPVSPTWGTEIISRSSDGLGIALP